jgi:hypothetical protein
LLRSISWPPAVRAILIEQTVNSGCCAPAAVSLSSLATKIGSFLM